MFYLEEINVIENAKFKEKDEMTYNKKKVIKTIAILLRDILPIISK